jgi:hypothetical protein
VTVPKIGPVAIRQSQAINGVTKSATFKSDSRYNRDVTLVTEFTMSDTALHVADPANVVIARPGGLGKQKRAGRHHIKSMLAMLCQPKALPARPSSLP